MAVRVIMDEKQTELIISAIVLGVGGLIVVGGGLLLLRKLRRSSLLREEKAKDKAKQLQQVVEAENLTNAEKLLLEILESSKQSAFVLKRFLFCLQVTAVIVLALIIGQIINMNT